MINQWFAIVMDDEDTDWGTGSFDREEAFAMAKDMNAYAVLTIAGKWENEDGDCLVDPICTDIEKL